MIPARPGPLFAWWFARDAEKRIAHAFSSVRVHGLEALRDTRAAGDPALVIANHTAWWDPLVAIYLTRRLVRWDAYAMMDAKNLRRLPFFAKVGAFGVDLDDPRRLSDRGTRAAR